MLLVPRACVVAVEIVGVESEGEEEFERGGTDKVREDGVRPMQVVVPWSCLTVSRYFFARNSVLWASTFASKEAAGLLRAEQWLWWSLNLCKLSWREDLGGSALWRYSWPSIRTLPPPKIKGCLSSLLENLEATACMAAVSLLFKLRCGRGFRF